MKKRFSTLSLLMMTLLVYPTIARDTPLIFFVYVHNNDTVLKKIIYKNTIGFTYKCKCYARSNDMEFRCADTTKSYRCDTLPKKICSMKEFAGVVNKFRSSFKNTQLAQSVIYIIEETSSHKYLYNKTNFYTIENDD